jgi:hypothetical protein
LPPPDFAIVGAPKCGTTALYTYLSAHPAIAMSTGKEPCYWSTDVPRSWRFTDRAKYDALWAGAAPDALRGEASTTYFESLVAIPRLLDARPDARLIAMIRNPLEMAVSRHADLVFVAQEEVTDLEAAWRLQEVRRRGHRVPAGCTDPDVLQYRQILMIGDQLERFVRVVPPAQRLVIVHDDFRRDTRAQYLRTLQFLGVEDDGRTDFTPVHTRRDISSLGAFRNGLKRQLGPFYAPLRRAARAVGANRWRSVRRYAERPAQRKRIRPAFEEELIAEFLPQIEKVERLLQRDLPSWKRPRSDVA